MKIINRMLVIFFIVYILLLLYIMFFCRLNSIVSMPYDIWLHNMYNLLPFRNLYDFLTAPVKTTDYFIIILKNILGNIVLFLPFGFFLPALFSKCANFKKFFLITLLTLFIVELLQFLTMLGAFDINDIVLNLIGAIVGFLINKYSKTKRLFNKQIWRKLEENYI